MFEHACKVGLEGVVSKVRDSRYPSGRGRDWAKKTCAQRETLTIAGFAMKERKFDGIFVGRQKGESLLYARKVDHGFDTATAKDLQARLKPLIRKTQPYSKRIAHKGIGSSRSCSPRSNIGRSRPRARCDIRSLRDYERTCN
jgi:bifunctional non-homologous end joining protein LigD